MHENHQTGGVRKSVTINRGRVHMTSGRSQSLFGTRPKFQLCGKHGHALVDFWHKFDESFTPTQAQSKLTYFPSEYTDKLEASTSNPQSLAMMAAAHGYSLSKELENKAWFVNLGVSHLTANSYFLHTKE